MTEERVKGTFIIEQKREIAEFFGFETRNKYQIVNESNTTIMFAAEQGKGFLGLLGRMFLGHWRPFTVAFFNTDRQLLFTAHHPFRIWLQRFEIRDAQGVGLGFLQQRFAIIKRHFEIFDSTGQKVMTMQTSIFKPWTFPVSHAQGNHFIIEKKWSGLGKELFFDADRFRAHIPGGLSKREFYLAMAAGIFIDLLYFERKANA